MHSNRLKNVIKLINFADDTVPLNEAFVNDLRATIEKKAAANTRLPSKSYKPSSMKCERQMYFQIIGEVPETENPNMCLEGICESGTDRHIRIQQSVTEMKDFGIECEYVDVADFVRSRGLTYLNIVSKQGMETKLYYPELNVSFLCDGIIKYRHKYYILEIKTEMSTKWQNRQDVDVAHYEQAIMYSICFGLNDVMFLYESRDLCDKKAYIFHVTDEMKADLIGKIEDCNRHVSEKTVPLYDEAIPKRTCTYCRYKQACKRAGK